jgi:DNA-directed RNA polymerase omega subunit
MKPVNIENVDKMTANRYEAVIVAAQHARHLNAMRLARLQQMQEGAMVDIEARKITMVALRDLMDGRVKFERSGSM